MGDVRYKKGVYIISLLQLWERRYKLDDFSC